MRFDPQANYVPGSASGGLEEYDYGGAGSGVLRFFGRLLALAMVAGLAGAGWWFWSGSTAVGGPSSENAFNGTGPQMVPWRSDDRVMSAYQSGLSAVATGQNHEAISHFKDAVVLDPQFAEGRYHLGLAYAQTGNHRAARAEHAALEELDPNLAMLLAEHLP